MNTNQKIMKSLQGLSFNELFHAFEEAFRDYDFQLKKKELKTMLIRRGFSQELSFGAFIENKLVSFTFNGIGMFNGVKTAYDTGTGTIAEYRGKGIASALLKRMLEFNRHGSVKCVNTQSDCESIAHFLNSFSIPEKGKQFEMIKKL